MASDEEIYEKAHHYRKVTGREPSLAWYAEQGDKQARLFCNAMGFMSVGIMVAGFLASAIVIGQLITGVR